MNERNYVYVTDVQSMGEDFLNQGKTEQEFDNFVEQLNSETDLGLNGVLRVDEIYITGKETAKNYNLLFGIQFFPRAIGD